MPSTKTTTAWTQDEEEIIGFFMDLIPILQEAKADLESKNLLDREFLDPRRVSGNKQALSLQT